MALEGKTKNINMNAYSAVNEVKVCQFYANINSDNPETMDIGRSIIDREAYKVNRITATQDQIDFEDEAYRIQDQMIAEKAVSEGGTL